MADLGEVTDSPAPAGGGVETNASVTKGFPPVTFRILRGQPSWEDGPVKDRAMIIDNMSIIAYRS
jgi:hypothetical protein